MNRKMQNKDVIRTTDERSIAEMFTTKRLQLLLQPNSDAPRGQITHRYRNEYRLSDDIETVSSCMTSLLRPPRASTKPRIAHFLIRRE